MSIARRQFALWVLLLNLIGFGPTAFACSTMSPAREDCCPSGQRAACRDNAAIPPTILESRCCAAQPTQSVISVVPTRKLSDSLAPPGPPVVAAMESQYAPALVFDVPVFQEPISRPLDGTQTYLLTARLRL